MGKEVAVEGGTKRLDPPYLSFAYSVGRHPHTCKNCQERLDDFKTWIRKRKKALTEQEVIYTHSNERVKKCLCKTW